MHKRWRKRLDEFHRLHPELQAAPSILANIAQSYNSGVSSRVDQTSQADVIASLKATPLAFWSHVRDALAEQDISPVACFDDNLTEEQGIVLYEFVDILGGMGRERQIVTASRGQAAKVRYMKASRALCAVLEEDFGLNADGDPRTLCANVPTLDDVLDDIRYELDQLAGMPEDECGVGIFPREGKTTDPSVLDLLDTKLPELLRRFEFIVESIPVHDVGRKPPHRQRAMTLALVRWFDRMERPTRQPCIDAAAAILRARFPDMKLVADPIA